MLVHPYPLPFFLVLIHCPSNGVLVFVSVFFQFQFFGGGGAGRLYEGPDPLRWLCGQGGSLVDGGSILVAPCRDSCSGGTHVRGTDIPPWGPNPWVGLFFFMFLSGLQVRGI